MNARKLRELELQQPIRYKAGDLVESWMNDLLCLNVSSDQSYNSFVGGKDSKTVLENDNSTENQCRNFF